MLTSYRLKHSRFSALAGIFLATAILALTPGPLFAQVESADVIPTVLSESDQATLAKEKAKLDTLRQGLLDDIAQQNTECGQVAESNTFQVDLCQNRRSFIMGRIGNYKTDLKAYRDRIQKALFMAPQGKTAVQSGLVFKDIPAPAPSAEPLKDAPNEPMSIKSEVAASVSTTPVVSSTVDEYFNDPENRPRVQRAKGDADQSFRLHAAVSQAMLNEVNRTMADVRARTVAKNPRLGREEVDRIVSQDPEVRRKAAMWYLIHNQTKEHAQDLEEDYEHISKETAKELDRKRGVQ